MSKLFKYLYFTICFVSFFTVRIHAYIDPSVMTYAIQAIAGVAIALGTVLSLYWRKILKFFRNVFNVKSTKHVIEESDDISFNDNGEIKTYTSISKEDLANNKPLIVNSNNKQLKDNDNKEDNKSKRSIKDYIFTFIKDMIPAALVVIAITYMICYYAPLEMYMNNKSEFWFNYEILRKECLGLALAFLLVLIIIYLIPYVINKKIYEFGIILGLTIFIVLYIHGNFYAGRMPSMDGSSVDWNSYTSQIYISIFISLVVFILLVFLYKVLKEMRFNYLVSFLCITISIMLTVSLISITNKTNGKDNKEGQFYVTTINENNYSSEDNFIILVVDSISAKEFS